MVRGGDCDDVRLMLLLLLWVRTLVAGRGAMDWDRHRHVRVGVDSLQVL